MGEFTQQRVFMERALDELKTRLGHTREKSAKDFRKKVGENTLLISECNALRTENRDLRAQMAQLHSEMRLQPGGGTPTVRAKPKPSEESRAAVRLQKQARRNALEL